MKKLADLANAMKGRDIGDDDGCGSSVHTDGNALHGNLRLVAQL
jgi:hypothetical protein